MIGSVAQIIALISHGNHFLRSDEFEGFFPQNSAFQFCNNVDFRLQTRRRLFVGSSVSVIAENPIKWFQYLKATKCDRLNFCYQHSNSNGSLGDHSLAGFVGGGGIWLIEAIYDEKVVKWTSYWDVTERGRSDQKIWSITYVTDGMRTGPPSPLASISSSREQLRRSLDEIVQFANKNSLKAFAPNFEKALVSLHSAEPSVGYYHPDLLAGVISLEQRQLFYAAANAWVFGEWDGGMINTLRMRLCKVVLSSLHRTCITR